MEFKKKSTVVQGRKEKLNKKEIYAVILLQLLKVLIVMFSKNKRLKSETWSSIKSTAAEKKN